MAANKSFKKTDLLLIFSGLAILFATPITALSATSRVETLTIESPIVCSPETHSTCLPGPFTVDVNVPAGATGGQIEVYWFWIGRVGQVQSNEHSWFTAALNGVQVDRVFCPDFGDEIVGDQFCGSVTFQATQGDALSLSILHADEERGPTPGSHRQTWVIHWEVADPTLTIPAPTIPADTPTPTMEAPTPTLIPPLDQPTETPGVPTPTATDALLTPVVPTPTDTPVIPVVPPPIVLTPTLAPTLPPPPPADAVQPELIPITGGDSSLSRAQEGLSLRLLVNAGLIGLGLALVIIGVWRSSR
jgi:hypothetical protein